MSIGLILNVLPGQIFVIYKIENVEITKERLASLVETFGSAMEYNSSTYFNFINANL